MPQLPGEASAGPVEAYRYRLRGDAEHHRDLVVVEIVPCREGQDYLPAVGGAFATTSSWLALGESGVSWREIADHNNTFVGLEAMGQLVPGNRTGTNVCDLYFAVAAGLEWST